MTRPALCIAALCNVFAAVYVLAEPVPLALNFTISAALGWCLGRKP